MAVLSKGHTFSTGDQQSATNLNNLVDNATFAADAVDNSTTQLSAGRIIVKDGGITMSKLEGASNGQIPIGTGSGFAKATLTAGTALGIINASGSVTIAVTDAELTAIAGLTSAADKVPYFTGSGTAALADLTAAGRALIDDADASAQRTTLGLGTMAVQAANNVAITGGSITNITDLAVADGGTGASTAAGARTNLGLGTDATGTNLSSLTNAGTARTNLGLGSAALEAYSTGTWTPSIGGTATYSRQLGTYTRIGRLCFIHCDIDLLDRGTGSQHTISGLPFTGTEVSALSVGYWDDSATSYSNIYALLDDSRTGINLWGVGAGGSTATLFATFFNTTSRIIISGCYQVA